MSKYSKLTLGQMEAVVNRLGGMEGLERFLSDKTRVVPTQFEVWKTITIGKVKTAAEFPNLMGPYGSGNPAILYSNQFTLAPKQTEIDLVRCSVFELGLRYGGTHLEIIACAKIYSRLELCPEEVGPELHLQWERQANETAYVGMDHVSDGEYIPRIFRVSTNFKGPYLDDENVSDGKKFNPETTFVFIKPRQ